MQKNPRNLPKSIYYLILLVPIKHDLLIFCISDKADNTSGKFLLTPRGTWNIWNLGSCEPKAESLVFGECVKCVQLAYVSTFQRWCYFYLAESVSIWRLENPGMESVFHFVNETSLKTSFKKETPAVVKYFSAVKGSGLLHWMVLHWVSTAAEMEEWFHQRGKCLSNHGSVNVWVMFC